MGEKKKNSGRRSGLPTQMNLVIRILAGAYLLYLAYSIYHNTGGMDRSVAIIFAVLFCITGGALAVFSARSLQRGEYEGGKADTEKENGEENKERTKKGESDPSGRIRFGEPETLPEAARKAENGLNWESENSGPGEEER